jgi:heme/copper-type cytochrome/quinol oxidase subunit 2
MNKLIIIVLLLFAVGCATEQKLTAIWGMPSEAPSETFQIKGKDCNWDPDIITVKQNTHVILEVESVDRGYNFNLKGYDLHFEIPKGKTVTAEVYADSKGEFEFGCYIEKGEKYYWGGMVGKLIVE